MDSPLIEMARQFCPETAISNITALGNGRINDTYLVGLVPPAKSFVLQRINSQVFPHPERVMQNLLAFTRHASQKLPSLELPDDRHWEIPQVLQATDGRPFSYDRTGQLWRAISFIENSTTVDAIHTPAQAQEVGIALGIFHSLLSDLPGDRLSDTLPGFHITPQYLQQFDAVVSGGLSVRQEEEIADCLRFVEERRSGIDILEAAKASGELQLRPIHGDPKVNNILFDRHTGQAISLVDLDTVKPGLVQYDIGDCLRSGCNPAGSNAPDLGTVQFDLQNFRAICGGVLCGGQGVLERSRLRLLL